MADAPSIAGGVASLTFTAEPNTTLLVTDNQAKFPTRLGNLSGDSGVSASMAVRGMNSSAYFIYYGEPSCDSTTSYVRFTFETSNSGGFDETHYWWSNPVHWDLTGNGSMTLTTTFDGRQWSGYYGHFGSDPLYSAGFQAALSNVTEMGLSFGGGCFFENGVGTSDGSGTFALNSFMVS